MFHNFIKLLIITITLLQYIKCDAENFKIIQIENGSIRGKVLQTIYLKIDYFAFRGIPYAKPPINNLRFEIPQNSEPWTNVLDTLETGNMCFQYNERNILEGNEDCLVLNVYTPSLIENLPVMFYIHGGGYNQGSSDEMIFGPDFLIDENVIIVTINYRLGVFGFMSLGTEKYPGNIGLRDQIHALKWVNKNIHSFGGDNKRITIFGHSAGSACTQFLSLSPLSENLFQRVISQSGSILNKWGYHYENEHQRDVMFDLSKTMGKSLKNEADLISFLKSIDKTELYEKIINKPDEDLGRKQLDLQFKPIIENKGWLNAFIAETPEQILNNQRYKPIDTMMGYTSDEILLMIPNDIQDSSRLEEFNERFEIDSPIKEINFKFQTEAYENISKKIKDFYFGVDGEVNNETLPAYVDMLSDVFFTYGIDKTVKYLSNRANIYYYRFSVDGALNHFKMIVNLTHIDGTAHADELCYLFKCKILGNVYENLDDESVERNVIKNMAKLWTNYAKYGNPTHDSIDIDWQPIKNNVVNFLDIRNDGFHPAINPNSKSFNFWNEILKEYNDLIIKDSPADESKIVDEL